MKQLVLTTCFLFFTMFTGVLLAQSATLSIQGVLRNSNGTAVENGNYEITFKLYTAETGGAAIWEDTFSEVPVEGGIYSVILGTGPNALDAPFDQPYFVGVSIEGGTELIPRASLTSSPYALSLIGSDNVFPNSGNVGIGDGNPQTKLTVKRGNSTIGFDADEASTRHALISVTADGLNFHTDGNNTAHIFTGDNGEKMRIETNGNVGVGTNNPTNKLHVKGDNEQIKVEGVNNANIGFYKTQVNSTQGASLGFDNANGNHLVLNNAVGQTHIKGNSIHLSPATGATNVNGEMNVIKNEEGLKLRGTDHCYMGFYPKTGQSRKAFFGFGAANSDDFTLKNQVSGADIKIIAGANGGNVKIESMVYLSGAKSITDNYYSWLREPPSGTAGPVAGYREGGYKTENFTLSSTNFIRAAGFHTFSDRRIKKELNISDSNSDLKTLNEIEVTNYRYIDEVEQGTDFTKGFIAQQVKEVFPEAVSTSKRFIPNLLTVPTQAKRQGGLVLFTLDKKHELKTGDHIKLLTKEGEQFQKVKKIKDEFSFSIDSEGLETLDQIIIYGKEVPDFHTVDYDRIYTLSVSAIQELSSKVEKLEKENASLQSSNIKSAAQNRTLKADLTDLNHRMKALENLFETTGKR